VTGGITCKNLLYVSANSAPVSAQQEMPCASIHQQENDFPSGFPSGPPFADVKAN
jgi:hypothetical protein